jgi:hypothetical protein
MGDQRNPGFVGKTSNRHCISLPIINKCVGTDAKGKQSPRPMNGREEETGLRQIRALLMTGHWFP